MDIPEPIKKGSKVSAVITFLVTLVIVSAFVEALGMFVPVVPQFVNRPIATIKQWFGKGNGA